MSGLPEIKLFNTLSRSIEPLRPITPGKIGVYCCGPTVYNYQHIGNLRTFIFEDILVRTLRSAGYDVNHVMNITDVGHLVSDGDDGEDKMLVAAKREKKSSLEIAAYYTEIFFEHCDWLNIIRPDSIPKATEHITEMIQLSEQLEQKGFAYFNEGNLYFDVAQCDEYGKLARLDLEQLQAGARIEVDSRKRNPLDFVLWFTKSKFENQELQWDSPWGRGYPGWHIECSAMASKYLGEHFDIHCGGIDHIPVHHTNEIAQSECASGKPFANVWLHGAFLLTKSEKMSKSTGDFLTLDKIKDRGLDPLSYRLFCLSGSYRSELVFSWEALESADRTLSKLKSTVFGLRDDGPPAAPEQLSEAAQSVAQQFTEEMYNDLGAPRALAVMHQMIADQQLSTAEKLALLYQFDELLGLGMSQWQPEQIEIPEIVTKLANERDEARKQKDWARADELRAQISEHGFAVEDTAAGPLIKPA